MKKGFKLIVPSFLAIIVCVLLLAGSTFALFTSDVTKNIVVGSATVNMTAEYTEFKAYSVEADDNGTAGTATAYGVTSKYKYSTEYVETVIANSSYIFANKGTAKLTDKNTIELVNVTPGDRITANLKVTNNSNVDIIYRVRLNAISDNGLLDGLTVKADDEPLTGVIKVGAWTPWDVSTETKVRNIGLEVVLPVDKGNEYQNKQANLRFTVEAVQANAKTDTLLDQVNAYLAGTSSSSKNNTMQDAIDEIKAAATTENKFANFVATNYLWNKDIDQFYAPYTVEPGFESHYFKAYTYDDYHDLEEVKYGVYAINGGVNGWPAELTIDHSFDSGEVSTITSIIYDRTIAQTGKTSLIRTNSSFTNLTINAAKDVVHHYGDAGILNIIAVAGSSYHENGNVAIVEIAKGRIALEETAKVEQIHISSIKEVDQQTSQLVTTNKFDEIIISIHENADTPTFSRDDVEIATTGTLVVALQTGTDEVTEETELDYVWLTKQGIFEQIKVSDNNESMEDAKWADDSSLADTNTQSAANDIANNIGRDTTTNEIKVEVTVEKTVEQLTETKTYKVVLNEDRDLVVVDKEDTEETPVATLSKAGEISVNGTKYDIELSNNTQDKTTELVVTNQINTEEVIKATAIEQGGLDSNQIEEVKEEKVTEAQINEVENDEDNAARIHTKGYATLKAAIDAAQDGDTVVLTQDRTGDEKEANTSINKNITLDLGNNILEMNQLTVYNLDNVTIKNGTLNGQLRIGEHQHTIVKWKYADQTAMWGYHPLAPAKNVVLNNVTINSGNKVALYFTNIEDDLTRANVSNPFDQDLYGHYIYKTGYQTQYEVVPSRDEIFTACSDKDHLTLNNCTINSDVSLIGKMYDINNNLYTEVLTINGGTFNGDSLGRFIGNGQYLVGTNASTYNVVNQAPTDYYARVNNIYYAFAGGADLAITFADFGETVYLKESSNQTKVFSEDEDGNPDKLTIYYETENIAYTGAQPYDATYDIIDDTEEVEGAHVFYSKFQPVAAVYATSQNGSWVGATKVGEYATLQDAVDVLTNNGNYTMVILKDFTVGDEQNYKYGGSTYKCAAGFANRSTIDFNGHRITYTGTGACIVSSQQTGYLYFKDSSGTNAGGITATGTGRCIWTMNAKSDYTYFYGGTYIAESNYAIQLDGGTGVTFYGGVYQTNHSTRVAVYQGWKITKITIAGGRFIAAANKDCVSNSNKIEISGGTFTKAPGSSIIIASGKTVTDNGDGTYTVK